MLLKIWLVILLFYHATLPSSMWTVLVILSLFMLSIHLLLHIGPHTRYGHFSLKYMNIYLCIFPILHHRIVSKRISASSPCEKTLDATKTLDRGRIFRWEILLRLPEIQFFRHCVLYFDWLDIRILNKGTYVQLLEVMQT